MLRPVAGCTTWKVRSTPPAIRVPGCSATPVTLVAGARTRRVATAGRRPREASVVRTGVRTTEEFSHARPGDRPRPHPVRCGRGRGVRRQAVVARRRRRRADARRDADRGTAVPGRSRPRGVARRHPSRRGRCRARVQPAQRQDGDGHCPGERHRAAGRCASRAAGHAAHAERGQGLGDGQWPGGQGPGRRHGDPPAAPRGGAEARRRGRRARAGDLPHLARWREQPDRSAAVAAQKSAQKSGLESAQTVGVRR